MFRFSAQFAIADEVCERWASGSGTGLPNPELADEDVKRHDPLPDDLFTEVDKIILHHDFDPLRRVLIAFYCERRRYPTVADVARRLGYRERKTVYTKVRLALALLLLKLNEHGTLERYARRRERDRTLRQRRAGYMHHSEKH